MTNQSPSDTPVQPSTSNERELTYYQDDEISLIDLWLVLNKQRRIGVAVFVIILAVAFIYTLVEPKKFDYTTSIEIGTRVLDDKIYPIEDPDTLLAKLTESYITLVLHDFRKKNPDMGYCNIKARIPNKSVIIVLESKGTESVAETCLGLQSKVVEKIKIDHKQINDLLKNEVIVKQNIAKNKLAELKDNAELLNRQEARYNDLLSLLKKQLIEVNALLKSTNKNRKRSVPEVKDEAKAMTLLLLDAEVQNLIGRQSILEERIRVDVANKMDELSKANLDNSRRQLEQKDKIAQLNISVINIRDTRAVVPPMQSLQPIGIGAKSIILLSLVVGGILALFSMFFAEFLSKVNEKVLENQQVKE